MAPVIVIPLTGHDKGAFEGSAVGIIEEVYRNKGVIYKADVKPGTQGEVSFLLYANRLGRPANQNFFAEVSKADTFIVISHMGQDDGPILAENNRFMTPPPFDTQPWCRVPNSDEFFQRGAIFWATVGRSRSNKVKIALLGCNSGPKYAGTVNRYAQAQTFGFDRSVASGQRDVSIRTMKGIEAGTINQLPKGVMRYG